MHLTRFDTASLAPMPWKNGKGVTREIVCRPSGATLDDFDWRISIADISAPSAFSVFNGIDRTLVLLQAAGVVLHGLDGPCVLSQPYQLATFAGEALVHAELSAGPSQDLNAMTRRGVCSATVQTLQATSVVPASWAGLVLSLKGQWALKRTGQNPCILQAGQGCWWEGCQTLSPWQALPQEMQAPSRLGATALLWVSVQPHNPEGRP